jgi:hypothetical protein
VPINTRIGADDLALTVQQYRRRRPHEGGRMQALAHLLRAGGASPPAGRALYNWTLAGDLASNAAYFGAVGAGSRERSVALGAALGIAAGAGAVLLPPYLGLSGATTGRTSATAALTVALYTAGGLVAGTIYRALPD